ncbi:aspartate 1-decarboxylase, partial [bacterium LRH843]|nr:aspartate 1-decarboxylase [bacterium LRH843]
RGSGEVCINGAAARLVQQGDLVIICTYAQMEAEKARHFASKIVSLDDQNRVKTHAPAAA